MTTTNGDYDETRYSLISMEDMYIASKRTVADLYPSDWVYEDFPDVAEFMDKYRKSNYPEPAEDASEEEWKAYMSTEIVWDSMGDGIADWYKEYKGWNKKQFCANLIDEETGYTYIEDFLAFMAGDQPLATDDTPATVENFKVNNLGILEHRLQDDLRNRIRNRAGRLYKQRGSAIRQLDRLLSHVSRYNLGRSRA